MSTQAGRGDPYGESSLIKGPPVMQYKVGEFQCFVFNDGPVDLVVSELFPNVPDSDVGWVLNHLDLMSGDDVDPRSMASKEASKQSDLVPSVVEVPNNVLVVRTGKEVVVVDCGPGARLSGHYSAGKLVRRMQDHGIRPEEVTHVLLTHAHVDRVGGAMESDRQAIFPNARFVISKLEFENWTKGQPNEAGWQAPENLKSLERATAVERLKQLEAIDKLDLVQFHCGPNGPPPSPTPQGAGAGGRGAKPSESRNRSAGQGEDMPPQAHTKHWGEGEEAEIVPGVSLVLTGGHTRGHCIVKLSSENEVGYAFGDLLMHPALLGHPHWSGGYHHDPPVAAEQMESWMDKAEAEKAKVQMYHFPFPGVGQVVTRPRQDGGKGWALIPTPPGRLTADGLASLIEEHHALLEPALLFVEELSDSIALLHRSTHGKPKITLTQMQPLVQKIDKHFASACALVEESRKALREGMRPGSVYTPEDFDVELSSKRLTALLHEYVWMVMDATYITESELVDLEFPRHSHKDFTELLYALDGVGELIVRFISAMKRSNLPVPFTVFGDHRMVLEVLGLELSEIVFWRQGALRYMYAATLINGDRTSELDSVLLETGADRLEKMRTLRHVKEPLSEENFVMGSGGAETFKLMEDGVYSDVHLLSIMYEAELWYWRWKEFEAKEVKDTSRSIYRERASHLCANYIRITTHSLADRGWNCDRAKQMLEEAEADDSIKDGTERLTLG